MPELTVDQENRTEISAFSRRNVYVFVTFLFHIIVSELAQTKKITCGYFRIKWYHRDHQRFSLAGDDEELCKINPVIVELFQLTSK